jgi:hypothetical protein
LNASVKIAALLILLPALATALTDSTHSSAADKMLRSKKKNSSYNREAVGKELTLTMEMAEALAVQARKAPPEALKEVWASGRRDFKLEEGQVPDTQKACLALIKAQEWDEKGQEEKAKAERELARDALRPHHKRKTEDYVRDLRNWISVSEGELRKANEAKKP